MCAFVLSVHALSLNLVGKVMIDFLLVMTELFSLAITADALLVEICRN